MLYSASVLQDALYLREYVRALSLAGLRSAAEIGGYPEVLGAVLPCYWVCWEVGKPFSNAVPQIPDAKRWLATYGREEFGTIVQAATSPARFVKTSARYRKPALLRLSSLPAATSGCSGTQLGRWRSDP